jgi:hypothetical protein
VIASLRAVGPERRRRVPGGRAGHPAPASRQAAEQGTTTVDELARRHRGVGDPCSSRFLSNSDGDVRWYASTRADPSVPSPPDLRSPRLSAALALGALLLAGCPSLLTTGPARTVPKGELQETIALGAYRTVLITESTAGVERDTEWMPLLEGSARWGLSDGADLGVRLGLGGASLGPRFQLVRSASVDRGVDVLLEPTLGVTGALPSARGGIVTGGYLSLALAVGINLGQGNQLVLTPRVAGVTDRFLGRYLLPGGSAALAIRVAGTDLRPWMVIPECGTAPVVRASGSSFDGPVAQCALGLAGPF